MPREQGRWATIEHPSWGGLDVGFVPFLVEAKEAANCDGLLGHMR
jgi:hypothetical protein